MAPRSCSLVALVLIPLAVVAAPVPEGTSALERVPASAPMVVHFRGIEGARDRAFTFMKNAVPELAPIAQAVVEGWMADGPDGILRGRKLRALAKDGPHFWVFMDMPKPTEMPKVAALISVTNYADFRDGLLKDDERKSLKVEEGYETTVFEGMPVFLVDKKTYAVITPQKDVALALMKKPAGLDKKMSREQAGKFLASDIGLYVSMDTLNKEYAEQIKQGRQFIEQALKAAKDGAGGEPTRQDKLYFALGEKMIAAAFQAVEDSQGVLTTLEFRPHALALHLQSELRKGSTTSGALDDSKPSALGELAELPGRRVVYVGQRMGPTLFNAVGGLNIGVTPGDDEQGKAINAIVASLAKAGPGPRVDGIGIPIDGVTVWKFDDPAAAVAAHLKLFAVLKPGDSFESSILKAAPKVTRDAEKHDGIEFHRVELAWDLDKLSDSLGPQVPEEMRKKFGESMRKLLGEQRTMWIGSDGKNFVRVAAADWSAARKLLADRRGKSSIGEAAAFRDARKEFPADATYLALIDLVPYAVAMLEFVKPFAPINPPPPPADQPPGFVGAAMSLTSARGSLDFIITSAAVKQAVAFAMTARQAGGQ